MSAPRIPSAEIRDANTACPPESLFSILSGILFLGGAALAALCCYLELLLGFIWMMISLARSFSRTACISSVIFSFVRLSLTYIFGTPYFDKYVNGQSANLCSFTTPFLRHFSILSYIVLNFSLAFPISGRGLCCVSP